MNRLATLFVSAAVYVLLSSLSGPAFAQVKVSISVTPSLFQIPIYIAQAEGFFKAQGLDVQVIDTRSGVDAVKMLVGGTVQFEAGSMPEVVQLAKQGINLVGVATLCDRSSNAIMVRKDLAKQIKSMRDLKGKDVGVTGVGGGTWQVLAYIASHEGMKIEDFNVISVGAGAAIIGAMKSGRVAAISYGDPEDVQMVIDGDAEFLVDMGDPATHVRFLGDGYLQAAIHALPELVRDSPATVQSLVNALQQSANWIHGQDVADVAAKLATLPYFKSMDHKVMIASLKRLSVPRTLQINRVPVDGAQRIMAETGRLAQRVAFEQYANNTFADAAAKAFPPPK